jgi:hypothetical protein
MPGPAISLQMRPSFPARPATRRSTSRPTHQGSDVVRDVFGEFDDIVQEWGEQSFPASDPPANW